MKDETIEHFMHTLTRYVKYWSGEDLSCQLKLEGFAHSILCMLDGVTDAPDIEMLEKASRGIMLHDCFYDSKEGSGC